PKRTSLQSAFCFRRRAHRAQSISAEVHYFYHLKDGKISEYWLLADINFVKRADSKLAGSESLDESRSRCTSAFLDLRYLPNVMDGRGTLCRQSRVDRRVLNGIFWVLRSGAPWRDLPDNLGPYTTRYNRFVRWRRAGVWARIMSALAGAHDAAVQMIDTSIVRSASAWGVHHTEPWAVDGAVTIGLTSKIHAVVDTNGLPVRLALSAGEAHDNRVAGKLLSRLKSRTMLLADRGYDADCIRALAPKKGAWANIPPRCNRSE